MEIINYKQINVEMLRSTHNPCELIDLATNITMRKNFETAGATNLEAKIKYLLTANHTSPFEHVNYTFLIKGASRSFLAQVTRHRMASFTSGSQHYQDYRDYGATVAPGLENNSEVINALNQVVKIYSKLVDSGIPNYEARQVLPNAMQNNLLMSINARGLINFFNLRLCKRNTDEIKIVSEKMYAHVLNHFPELFRYVGPDCKMKKCTQGRMGCNYVK